MEVERLPWVHPDWRDTARHNNDTGYGGKGQSEKPSRKRPAGESQVHSRWGGLHATEQKGGESLSRKKKKKKTKKTRVVP